MIFMAKRNTYFPIHREDAGLVSMNFCHKAYKGGKCNFPTFTDLHSFQL